MKTELVCKRTNKSKRKPSTGKDALNHLQIIIPPAITTTAQYLLNVDYNFENGTVENMISKLLDEVFFQHNNGEFESSTIEVFTSMCKDHQQGCPINPSSSVEIARRSNERFITKFLELFFPNFNPETIQRLQENIRFTISGIIRGLHTVLKFRSLLDQIQKIFFASENYIKFFYEKFPYTDQIDPFEAPKQVCKVVFT